MEQVKSLETLVKQKISDEPEAQEKLIDSCNVCLYNLHN